MIKKKLKKLHRKFSALLPFSKALGNFGERVDIYYGQVDFDKLDHYQKSHYQRYIFALSQIRIGEVCADLACGTGYGSALLAEKAQWVVGIDKDTKVINTIRERYSYINNVTYLTGDLLKLDYWNTFDTIISFETIEHFIETDIFKLLKLISIALKPEGKLILSTPYMQEKSEAALELGHHKTFLVNERKVASWLNACGFGELKFFYQNYDQHIVEPILSKKDFLICQARKNTCL